MNFQKILVEFTKQTFMILKMLEVYIWSLKVKMEKYQFFVVPHNDDYLAEGPSSDKKHTSQAIDLQRASIIVVGEQRADINQMKDRMKKRSDFQSDYLGIITANK